MDMAQMDTAMNGENSHEMPCEESTQNQQDDQSDHCAGMCLCMHSVSSQSPILNDSIALQITDDTKLVHSLMNESFVDISLSLPKRPPRV